jgi:hypothetical protein
MDDDDGKGIAEHFLALVVAELFPATSMNEHVST